MSYGRNRQSLLSGPRSRPFFAVQTAARVPPHPDAPGPLVPQDETETESGAPIMSYGPFFAAPEAVRYCPLAPPPTTASARTRRPHPPCSDPAPRSHLGHEPPPGGPKPAKRAKRPRSYPFFVDQTAARLPPHPDAPGLLVPWDQTEMETQSEARIMGYGRNRQSLLSGPRSCLFFAVQTAARLPPPTRCPQTAGPVGPNGNGIEGPDHELRPLLCGPLGRAL